MSLNTSWNPASPVDHPIRLSGTFGELRTNHFHAGIDIKKSGNAQRDAIYSIEDGFISRISIKAGGYGNCLYIDHKNGFTSVYAHLDNIDPRMANYVKENQYKKESFEIELFPNDTMFQVKKGDKIGEMGNTGSSNGAHLHFEIRQTAGQIPLNPLQYNFALKDNIGPNPKALYVHYMDKDFNVFKKERVPLRKIRNGKYVGPADTLHIGAWRVGFAIEVRDKMDATPNNNGIYSLETMIDSQIVHSFSMDKIPFAKSKFINAHIDYAHKTTKGKSMHRCYQLPGNQLDIYNSENNGIVNLYEKQSQELNIVISDALGNESALRFHLLRDSAMSTPNKDMHNFILPYDEPSIVKTEDASFEIPKGALYSDLKLYYFTSIDSSAGYFSPIHHMHKKETPLHKRMLVKIKADAGKLKHRNKAFIAYCDKGKFQNCGGKWDGEFLSANVSRFGDYAIRIDQVPPTIEAVNFSKFASKKKHFTFKIKDDLSSRDDANGLSYSGRIDGKWVLCTFDAKSSTLRHTFEDNLERGEHVFELEVKDSVGNITRFQETFNY